MRKQKPGKRSRRYYPALALSITAALIGAFVLSAAAGQEGEKNKFLEPADRYNIPKSYICYKTKAPLNIDGKLNESAWKKSAWTDYFVDIEGSAKSASRFKTRIKMLWDEKYFYVGAELDEPDIWGTLTQRDSVIYEDNDFEVFIDPDGDTHNYYELEINALGTVWDLLLIKPYRVGDFAINAWDIAGLKSAVSVSGTINKPGDKDKGWTVELAMPWEVLRECAPLKVAPSPGHQWRVNFSRVEYQVEIKGGKYMKKKDPRTGQDLFEDNWVWSPQGLINMHFPERWGYVQFSGKEPGAREKDIFRQNPAAKGEWALWQLYYAEKTYLYKNGKFSDDLAALQIDGLIVPGFKWPPRFKIIDNDWTAGIESEDGKTKIYINSEGRIWK